ncbi:MAG: hypothetical protein ABIK65_12940 [Candidatus Eisenbacteria bacterium]
MKKFFESGAAFMVVALIMVFVGFLPGNSGVLVGAGGFWLIMAIVTHSKYKKNQVKNRSE